MDTIKTILRPVNGKSFLVVFALTLAVALIFSTLQATAAAQSNKEKIARGVAQKWIQIGTEQFKRGYFRACEQSLLRARDYQQYLTAPERDNLNAILEKAHTATLEQSKELGQISVTAEIPSAQPDKAALKLSQNFTLPVKKAPAKLEAASNMSQIQYAAAPKNQEQLLSTRNSSSDSGQWQIIAKPDSSSLSDTDVGFSGDTSYLDIVKRRRNIARGHTKAVVEDAVSKAQLYMASGEFDRANEAVENAKRVVNENYLQLGEYLFKQYNSQLRQLKDTIAQKQKQQALQIENLRHREATEAQRHFRQRMEIEREKRIFELLRNTLEYQKKQKYEEALGQLESLLAIDPLHNEALILKQTLEDIIGFRKQLELQKESDKERIDILLKTDESGIPYAKELTHPKNWREIIAKPTRQPEEAIGYDPASAATFRQLEEVVDLSELTPEMSLGEAIDQLKNSVTPQLKIIVLWRDLYDNAEIDQTTQINMGGISAVPLGTVLELLLKSVSGGFVDLGYIVENGVITIATTESLPSKLETLVYDVTHLIGRPADFYSSTGGGGGVGGGGGGGGGARGGGGGGGGGGMGGGGGTGGGYFAEYFDTEEEEIDREQMREEMIERRQSLIDLIVNTIEPDSWFETGTGEGTITFYENKKLIVRQTREIHNKIQKLLREMRKALGHQVAIEARFLIVGENFLEDIGLNMNFEYKDGLKGNIWNFEQGSYYSTIPQSTGVTGSLGTQDILDPIIHGIMISGAYHTPLDDLSAAFLIRAAEAHTDSKSLTAPKVTVLSGESATIRVQRTIRYALPPDITYGGGFGAGGDTLGGGGGFGGYGSGTSGMQQNYGEVPTGTILNITPTVTPDKKHVLLNIVAELRDFLGFESTTVEFPTGAGGEISEYEVKLPQTEISRVRTRVSVPDGGTLLLGGQKVTEEIEKEAGVPILSKIPILGRLFSNRSTIKDQKILIILVKPTIILQEEADAEAIAELEKNF